MLQETPASLTIQSWRTFTNDAYRYEIDYPDTTRVEWVEKDGGTVQIFADTTEPLLVTATADFQPGDVTYYLDTKPVGQRSLGEVIWLEYRLPDGYCDGQGCSPPIYALQTERAGVLYQVTVYSQATTTELQTQILSTFRFSP